MFSTERKEAIVVYVKVEKNGAEVVVAYFRMK